MSYTPTYRDGLLLKEYRGISLSAPSLPKSPRKSAKEYTETVEDLVAPFDHYLDESILEEDFMIEGNIEFKDCCKKRGQAKNELSQ